MSITKCQLIMRINDFFICVDRWLDIELKLDARERKKNAHVNRKRELWIGLMYCSMSGDKQKRPKWYREKYARPIERTLTRCYVMLLIQLKMKSCPNKTVHKSSFFIIPSSMYQQSLMVWRWITSLHTKDVLSMHSIYLITAVLLVLLRKNSVIFQDDWWEWFSA